MSYTVLLNGVPHGIPMKLEDAKAAVVDLQMELIGLTLGYVQVRRTSNFTDFVVSHHGTYDVITLRTDE